MSLTLRLALSTGTGIFSSLIVNFAALEYISSHAYQGRIAVIFFALALSGFEEQILAIPINVLVLAVCFGVASFWLLSRRQKKSN
jgi:hypothetical protein